MNLEVLHRSWRVSLVPRALSAFLTETQSEDLGPGQAASAWLTVEALLAISGMRPHGLLIARYVPSGAVALEIEASDTGRFVLEGPSSGGLLGLELHAGLPFELADAATAGAGAAPCLAALGGGLLTFAGGGLDADSSPLVFEHLGQLAVAALAARRLDLDDHAAIQRVVSGW